MADDDNFESFIERQEINTYKITIDDLKKKLASKNLELEKIRDKGVKFFKSVDSLFICHITLDIMTDPVMDNEGTNYERSAINEWLDSGKNSSPTTKQPLNKSDLRPNLVLKQVIDNWLESNPQYKKRGGGKYVKKTMKKSKRKNLKRKKSKKKL